MPPARLLSARLLAPCVLLVVVTALLAGCGSPTDGGDDPEPLNPNLTQLSENGIFWMGAWSANGIVATKPVRHFVLDDTSSTETGSSNAGASGARSSDAGPRVFERPDDGRPVNFVSTDADGRRLLFVRSYFADVSLGSLHTYDLTAAGRILPGEAPQLRSGRHAVSSAVYAPGDSSVVYFSYGSAASPEPGSTRVAPGYYRLHPATGADSLLLPHVPAFGPTETVRGFDLSPDGRTLAHPVHDRTGAKPPRIVLYNLDTQTGDTLDVAFDAPLLWLRFDPSGDRLLYGNYPRGAGGNAVAQGGGEIGIITLSTRTRRVLDVDTNPYGPSLSVFPHWDPSGSQIVFGSGKVTPRFALGDYALYVLRDVSTP